VFDLPGTYTVCETITTEYNCSSETCQELLVVPATIQPINIITPNGDGKNDFLTFDFIEFFPENHLMIFNRWGGLIYESHGYSNTWSGVGLSDGTYYYILDLKSDQRPIESDLLIKRD
jgi:gliding motility-associated-like protein